MAVIQSFLYIDKEPSQEEKDKHPIIMSTKDLTNVKIVFKELEYKMPNMLKALDIYLKIIVRFDLQKQRTHVNITTFLIQRFYKIFDENDFVSPNLIKLHEMFAEQ